MMVSRPASHHVARDADRCGVHVSLGVGDALREKLCACACEVARQHVLDGHSDLHLLTIDVRKAETVAIIRARVLQVRDAHKWDIGVSGMSVCSRGAARAAPTTTL